uniref:Uncharacterized protein n=1 Tax=Clandestinovirus TaxID=2831644 RepID=A0A8F8PMU8_9VIRU|nr:hypothetical protein KOM_12_607 [Clandestinovirus]
MQQDHIESDEEKQEPEQRDLMQQDLVDEIESVDEETNFVDPELRTCDYCNGDGVCQYGPNHGDNLCSECMQEQKDSIEDSSSSSEESEEEEDIEEVKQEKTDVQTQPPKYTTLTVDYATTRLLPMDQEDENCFFAVKQCDRYLLHAVKYANRTCTTLFVDPLAPEDELQQYRLVEADLQRQQYPESYLNKQGYEFVADKDKLYWNPVDQQQQTLDEFFLNIHMYSNQPAYEPEKYVFEKKA